MRDERSDLRGTLPWQRRKSLDEDPLAHERIEAITRGAGYRIAEEDRAFLQQNETRGVRLELDYLKAELLLQQHGIEHTIVVFGSTRIIEERTAERQLESAQNVLKSSENSLESLEEVEIAERILAKSRYYEIAREFGRLVGSAGKGPGDSRITLMTGGGPRYHGSGQSGGIRCRRKIDRSQYLAARRAVPQPLNHPRALYPVPLFCHQKTAFPAAGERPCHLSRRFRHARRALRHIDADTDAEN